MAQCWYPYHVEQKFYTNQGDKYVPVPCGKCPTCLTRRASIWGFRLRKQEELSSSAFFVTLTYDNDHLQLCDVTYNKDKTEVLGGISRITPKGFMTLQKKDFQNFMKLLRNNLNKQGYDKKISYYACGEYGGKYRRPHYHAIIFNAPERAIHDAWTHGTCFIGTVTGASISYTVKYINKGTWKPLHKNDDRNPEFALMSKRMGANYLTPRTVDFHRSDLSKAFVTLPDGIKMALPRYYKDKLFPTTAPDKIVFEHPSIIHHLEDNERLRKDQQRIIAELIAMQPPPEMTDLERHEARKNAIENFQNKYKTRKDL